MDKKGRLAVTRTATIMIVAENRGRTLKEMNEFVGGNESAIVDN